MKVKRARIVYEERSEFNKGGEAYAIYTNPNGNEDWGFCCAFPMNNDLVSYRLVTQIRELMNLGYEITWR